MIFILGRGLRKFNNSLLYEMDYVEIAKETNKNKPNEQYAALVYVFWSINYGHKTGQL